LTMIWDFLPYLLQGAEWTLGLVAGGLTLGFALGVPIAILQTYGGGAVKRPTEVYVWFFRSVPLLVLLFLFYWGLFPTIGLPLDTVTTSIVVLGLRSAAYQSQIFRGAIFSVGEGQLVAARAVGMSRMKAIRHIMLPQALRISLPGWSNEYASILKDSAVCFALGVLEILTRARYVVMATDEPLIPYFIAGGLFLVLTYGGTKVLHIVYERTRIAGLIGRQ
jgi:polar amino acid transport system permease protein